MPKKALITGITGQMGSYLARLLSGKGYEVHGLVRRSSTFNTERIDPILDELHLYRGDVLDAGCINKIIAKVKPHELYNYAAQSHVKVSFECPEFTMQVNTIGLLNVLEAVKVFSPSTKVLQASTSEMFGISPPPQDERTPFKPKSPYGVSKVAAHFLAQHYRDAFKMFVSCSICFNNESISENTPVVVRQNGIIDILPIREVVPFSHSGADYREAYPQNLEVWDGQSFTKVLKVTAYKHKPSKENKAVRRIVTRAGFIETTGDHVWLLEEPGMELEAKELHVGDKAKCIAMPEPSASTSITVEEAELIGLIAGDGSAFEFQARICGRDPRILRRGEELWKKVTGGTVKYGALLGGYDPSTLTPHILLQRDPAYCEWLSRNIYTRAGREKKIPRKVLNGTQEVLKAFFRGYYAADGLQPSSTSCTYEFQRFATSSQTLAAGLMWIAHVILKQQTTFRYPVNRYGDNYCYVDLLSPNLVGLTGQHFVKPHNEVTEIVELPWFKGWLYDFTTESGVFHCGPGELIVHNSPVRLPTFVTRKITRAAARISLGLQDKLTLGWLGAKRDWGHSKDFCTAQWLMLQQDKPDDFVVATGEMHSIKDLLDLTFGKLNLRWQDYVETDERYMRPAEVPALCGDYSKAKATLGWEPTITFEELIQEMLEYDLKLAKQEKLIKERG